MFFAFGALRIQAIESTSSHSDTLTIPPQKQTKHPLRTYIIDIDQPVLITQRNRGILQILLITKGFFLSKKLLFCV